MWYEKYTPKTINDCILSDTLKSSFQEMVRLNDFNSMIFYGPPGVGKTTLAKAFASELQSDCMLVAGSKDAGIDVLRTTVMQFASNMSMSEGRYKVVIFDEADYIPAQSTQPALRGFIDEFAATTRFIFTCNYPHRIIEPLHSRCLMVDFTPENKDKTSAKLALRILEMCKADSIKVDQKALLAICQKVYPDFRATINLCEHYARTHGKIDSGILNHGKSPVLELVEHILKRDFHRARIAVAHFSSDIYAPLYQTLLEQSPDNSLAIAMIVSKYEHMSTFAVNQEVCLAGCVAELIKSMEPF